MREIDKRTTVRRRVFLRGAATAPAAAAAAAAGLTIGPDAAWAADLRHIKPATMTVLARAARDIFPHDRLADRYYIAAVVPYDDMAAGNAQLRTLLEEGAAQLDAEAKKRFGRDYIRVAAEEQRVEILKSVEKSAFFQKLRGDLVVSLYNQKEVWAKFGYEGSSHEHGGYIQRGFNDIDWLPET
ncbi:gluconate 2-dehydrogenase subunit 3 family protein [Paracraurococcus ruber]|uniref:Twin-arginine translocation pathway signal n=1 Tax=Paracraurococcus ruber TaxID=77675 RepID=A0ABS1CZ49_9PROT|nr:gluconate 2-dehydrogenase subunit 3 family protein [Paracraurococcus ruber]MBK1659801.1 Twin-arginine translocation pathway signal [Paracraurococcus ruber]TDG34144.1 gluconate 2-dehydrogenase subunit 3 family protein [Paracraurococcus ruber]